MQQRPIIAPDDAHDVTSFKGKLGICGDRDIHIFDLERYEFLALVRKYEYTKNWFSLSAVEAIMPNLSHPGESAPMRALQERITNSKPLGLVRSGSDELLAVFNGRLIWYRLLFHELIFSSM